MIRINLLKPERKEFREVPTAPTPEFKEKRRQPWAALLLIVALIAAAVLFFYQRNALTREQNLLRAAKEEKKSLQYVVVKLEELEKQKNLFQRKIKVITQLQARQENAVIIMDELSRHLPNWVWLTELTFISPGIQIKGRAVSNNLIADYIYNLEKSQYFNEVNLISSTQRRAGNNQYLDFSLTANFTNQSSELDSESQKEGEGQ